MAQQLNVTLIPIRPKGLLKSVAAAKGAVRRALTDMVAEGQRYMAEYPPQPPESRYRRTGDLKKSWIQSPASQVKEQGGAMVGVMGSNSGMAPYNRDVQGVAQRAFFRGRGWRNVNDLRAKVEKELAQRVQREIDKVVQA